MNVIIWKAVGVRVELAPAPYPLSECLDDGTWIRHDTMRYRVVLSRWPGRDCVGRWDWWRDDAREAVAMARRLERLRKSIRAGEGIGTATSPTLRRGRRCRQ